MRNNLVNKVDEESSLEFWLEKFKIAVVIPSYNVANQIESVLNTMPSFITYVIVVNDASKDITSQKVKNSQEKDSRIILIEHEKNKGVGGAMVTGFQKALSLDPDIVVKMDGDGQMNPKFLPELLIPLILGIADYTKGNRFRDFQALRKMPPLRRIGNIGLSFMVKAATGYWKCFDPTNGFLATRADVLQLIPLDKIHTSYFFEISFLSQMYLVGAVVKDIPMPALYGDEKSNLSIKKVLLEFPGKLFFCFCRRVVLKKFIYDFSIESVYLIISIPMILAGATYGGYNWYINSIAKIATPTGTVVLPSLLIILGFQIILAAVGIDLQSFPQEPICNGPLTLEEPPRLMTRNKK
ncbi:MAG: glycosyltransferase family 2 protein [Acidobacteria bacterium]|nr:glycosyltransferase family 2 protein [Acidobacteriota bacterium]